MVENSVEAHSPEFSEVFIPNASENQEPGTVEWISDANKELTLFELSSSASTIISS